MEYILQFARKNKYGSLGWAFDCDEHGNITDEKMLQGYNDMIAKCQTWKDSHNSNIEIKDMFNIWNRVIKMED